jgi:glucosyl-dolichyl phosphate glucuronosyltransferase
MKLSVIIPTYNRSLYLDTCLKSLLNQSLPKSKYEIIIVDNGSTDNTKKVVRRYIEAFKNQVRYIFEPIPGLLAGRHRGLKESKGNILVFCDDDIVASKGCLDAIYQTFLNKKVQLVTGRFLPKYEAVPPYWEKYLWSRSRESSVCGHYSLADYGKKPRYLHPNTAWGLLFPIRKKTLIKYGGFNPDCIPKRYQYLQGDGETGLCERLAKEGIKSYYVPEALVHHWVTKERLTLDYLSKRMFYQGICSSYTDLRNRRPASSNLFTFNNFYSLIFLTLQFVKNFIFKLSYTKARDIVVPSLLNIYFIRGHNQGYNYHQRWVRTNPKLINWIRKKNYFNYKLPTLT